MSTTAGSCCSDVAGPRVASQLPLGDGSSAACRGCGSSGTAVERRTLLHMLEPDQAASVGDRNFRFCESAACDKVYYSTDGELMFGTEDLRERVGVKMPGDPSAPVCYCFGFTVGDLEAEGGATEIPERIRGLVRERMCACEVRNPSGRCCLGAIARVVRRIGVVEGGLRPAPTSEQPGDRLVTEEKRA
jgi:hypothetical protein